MKNIGIVGHVDHAKTTLTSAIKSVLQKEEHGIYKDALDEVIEYRNPYAFLNKKQPASKSRLKKCEKGLHEFKETDFKVNENGFSESKWYCMHCGVDMHNR